ncbi:hypothetical protein GCM10025867_22050 [Frondihabitans sucicola]|uniref:DUF6993 domain-containing protein n=1 Tax=Frondihabitans sucicola TaxID=1268041 RepID=A0ABN6XY52_9MICO|nr:hypothetical protein [Frondihabitans sucicola]BDZ49964.1 hypothetical protein GCM10025867_22050 [Frondihabitans sucicola]
MLLRPLRPRRVVALTLVAITGVVVLAGCTNASPTPSPAVSNSASAGSPSAAATPTPAPSYDANASTPEALAEFTAVVTKKLAGDPQPHGRDIVDALAAAGFDKKAMQLTPDDTTIGRNVDSIEFSVLWKNNDCLIGQVGSAGFSSESSPVLSTGKCLIGTTRTIDW